MKKYILLIGVAGVALGSYCAYAGNSATMTVTATIAHDVSLTKTGDINLGTITINPAYAGAVKWDYNESGTASVTSGADGIVSIDTATFGTFTANIANPSACDGSNYACGGLSVPEYVEDIFGGDNYSSCVLAIAHDGENRFKVVTTTCAFRSPSDISSGTHEKSITINYTAS